MGDTPDAAGIEDGGSDEATSEVSVLLDDEAGDVRLHVGSVQEIRRQVKGRTGKPAAVNGGAV